MRVGRGVWSLQAAVEARSKPQRGITESGFLVVKINDSSDRLIDGPTTADVCVFLLETCEVKTALRNRRFSVAILQKLT